MTVTEGSDFASLSEKISHRLSIIETQFISKCHARELNLSCLSKNVLLLQATNRVSVWDLEKGRSGVKIYYHA